MNPNQFIDAALSDDLEHYGVLGMKWGVRKDRRSSSSTTTSDAKKNREAISERKKASRNRRTLSDSDLDDYINRLNKEKQLKKLVDEDTITGRGTKFINAVMSDVGKRVLTTVGAGAGTYLIGVAVASKFDVNAMKENLNPVELAKAMQPKKK